MSSPLTLHQAFTQTPRADFLPPHMRRYADNDAAEPIGYGQTNSQPTVVEMMLKWLAPRPGDHVLDIGSGSGWTTALLSRLVGPEGCVEAVERVPELVEAGRANCAHQRLTNVQFYRAGTMLGLPDDAPFDRILVSAAAEVLPTQLLDQLERGGALVIPVQSDIIELHKLPSGNVQQCEHHGFVFVPLVL